MVLVSLRAPVPEEPRFPNTTSARAAVPRGWIIKEARAIAPMQSPIRRWFMTRRVCTTVDLSMDGMPATHSGDQRDSQRWRPTGTQTSCHRKRVNQNSLPAKPLPAIVFQSSGCFEFGSTAVCSGHKPEHSAACFMISRKQIVATLETITMFCGNASFVVIDVAFPDRPLPSRLI